MNIVDYITILIICVCTIDGIVRGFVLSFFNLIGFVVSIYIAKTYYPVVSKYVLSNTNLFSRISDFVNDRVFTITKGIQDFDNSETVLNIFKLPTPIKESMIENAQTFNGANSIVNNTQGYMSSNLTTLLINLLSIFIIFIVVRFLIYILTNILNTIVKIPILKQFNTFLGLIFGVTKGILIVYIVFAILTPIVSMFPHSYIADKTTCSTIGCFFYYNNIIINYLKVKGLLF